MRTIGGLRVDDLIAATMRTGETSTCEIDAAQFGNSAGGRWPVFAAFLTEVARDGLHIDYQAGWNVMMDMPVEARLLKKLPGRISRSMSHDLGPTVLKLTLRRMLDMSALETPPAHVPQDRLPPPNTPEPQGPDCP